MYAHRRSGAAVVVVQEKKSSTCKSVKCCCEAICTLVMFAVLFLLVACFFGDGDSISQVRSGVKITSQCYYLCPWGTNMALLVNDDVVCSKFFWFTNLLDRQDRSLTTKRQRAINVFTQPNQHLSHEELEQLGLAVVKQIPVWMKNNLKRYLDRSLSACPQYRKYASYVQPLLDSLCEAVEGLNLAKLSQLWEDKKYEALKVEIIDYLILLNESKSLDSLIPPQWMTLYNEWRAFFTRELAQLKKVPAGILFKCYTAISNDPLNATKHLEAIREISKYAPTYYKDYQPLVEKTLALVCGQRKGLLSIIFSQ